MKRIGHAILSMCLLFFLPSCAPMGAAPVEEEAVVLTFMMPQSHYKDFLQRAISTFEAAYPAIHIDPQIIPDNQWIDLVKRKVAVGETPDLIRLDRGLIIDVGLHHFVPFGAEEPWYDRVLPEQLDSKLINGTLYGLPVGANSSIGIVYNRTLFEKHGVAAPKSMEALYAACEQFKLAGVVPLYASDKDSWTVGLGFTAAAPQVVPMSTWEKLWDGTLRWSEVSEFTEILNAFTALRMRGYTNSNYLEATYASAVTAMADGNTAMYITGQFFVNDVQTQNPDVDIMMTAVPYKAGVLTVIPGPGQLSLFQNCTHQAEAKLFLDWFSQPENMDRFNAGWGHTAVYRDQNLQFPDWQQALDDEYISKGNTVMHLDSILSGIDLNDFWSYQQEMLTGVSTAGEALEKWNISFSTQMREKAMLGEVMPRFAN